MLARHFAYDLSVPNASAIFSSRSHSGCGSVFPYPLTGSLWELPWTLPTDWFRDLAAGYRGLREVADRLVALGGVLVLTLHPQPHQSGNPRALAHFGALLRDLDREHGPALWRATPREIVARYRGSLGGARGTGGDDEAAVA